MKSLFFSSLFALVLLSGNAFAQEGCIANDECPVSFECTQIELPCGDPTQPWEGCACKDGDDACGCPSADVVNQFGSDDAQPCVPEIVGVCTFAPAECEDDLDCTSGFECREQEYCYGGGCECAGGGGTSEDCVCPICDFDAGDPCPPCECDTYEYEWDDDACSCEEEECETLGSVCVPAEVPCLEDGDCLDGFECAVFGGGRPIDDQPCMNSCTCEPVADGDPDAQNCWCEEVCDGTGDEIPDQPPEEGLCLPDGWLEEFKSVDDGIYYEGNDEQAGTDDPRGEDTYGGTDVATVGDTAPTGEADNTSTKKSSTSCAVGNGPATSGAALLALLLVGLALLRRRHPQV